jgi:membrane protein
MEIAAIRDRARPAVTAAREVIGDLVEEWQADRVPGLAAEIAFFGLLSLFPTLLALTAALGSLEVLAGSEAAAQVESEIIGFLNRVLTEQADETIAAVRDLFDGGSSGVVTVGLVVALWSASRGFVAVVNALDVAYDLEERRSFVRLRAVSLALAVGSVLVVSVILTMVVIGPLFGSGKELASDLGFGSAFATAWDWVRWPFALAVMIGWAATVLHVAPNHRTAWKWDLPGAVLAALLWAGFSLAFRFYLAFAPEANQVLGTLGGALIVLLWLYLLAIGLLMGGELNAVLTRRYDVPQHDARFTR